MSNKLRPNSKDLALFTAVHCRLNSHKVRSRFHMTCSIKQLMTCRPARANYVATERNDERSGSQCFCTDSTNPRQSSVQLNAMTADKHTERRTSEISLRCGLTHSLHCRAHRPLVAPYAAGLVASPARLWPGALACAATRRAA